MSDFTPYLVSVEDMMRARDERVRDATHGRRCTTQQCEVGARRAEEAPDQQEECKHTEYPDNQSLRVLGFEGRGESGQVERIKEGQRGTDQPEKSIGQVFLTQGSA